CLMPISKLYINNFYGLFGIYEIPFWIGAPLTVFIIVFITNAINLIDGIDGLAASLSLIALGGFLLCFMREGVWTYGILIAGLMGVLIPYLYFNIWGEESKNRKIFMGDSGSLTLGFILGFLFVKFTMDNPYVMPFRKDSLLLSYTLLIVPCFDVVRVVFKRLRERKPIFQADKNHIHHKLLRAGCNQRQALITILLLALSFVLLNNILDYFLPTTFIVLIDVIVYIAFHLVINSFIRDGKPREN
ncbi:MAG: undecaprenyl/decaprenyl-phosphate alpha-N-acetylglucosaminyl 1-phosphate transferase, partial [Prevotella sp.]|nr:undecaprenyl/decaprenyl-phosphate alpha-N-acetylglucosaminyl 1-phosphate transferase [Prevotella sp.]